MDPALINILVSTIKNEHIKKAIEDNDLDRLDIEGQTPLIIALQEEGANISELLIKLGANVLIVDNLNRTPLIVALEHYSNLEQYIIQMLLEYDININHIDNRKQTALTIAIRNKNVDISVLDMLLDAGADPNVAPHDRWTPLTSAINYRDLDLVDLLVSYGADVNITRDVTPLIIAVFKGDIRVLEYLLDSGGDVNLRNVGGVTPLMVALKSEYPNIEIVDLLLKVGADVNITEYIGGMTPLMLGLENNKNSDAIELLIDYGADLNTRDYADLSVIDYAIENNWGLDMIELLIQNGATINAEIETKIKTRFVNYDVKSTSQEYIDESQDICTNLNIITLEDYTHEDDPLYIYLPNEENKFRRAICVTKDELREWIRVDKTNRISEIFMGKWIGSHDSTGYGGDVDGVHFFMKLPMGNIYVTTGSVRDMLNSDEKKWFAFPIWRGRKIRIGNLAGEFGVSRNHGQEPGETIYKLMSKSTGNLHPGVLHPDDFIEPEEIKIE